MSETAAEVLATAVRDSRARLLSYLAPRTGGDLAAAEDAVGDAVLAALQQWPHEGIPAKPEAWLLAVARRRIIDEQRRHATRLHYREALQQALELAEQEAEREDTFPDDRLKLMLVCAHPAIDETMRTPLMLQVVLGLEAAEIASAFLIAPATMAQRLVRAKAKIKASAVPFEVPSAEALRERLGFVLDAVYAAFTLGSAQLMEESLRLGQWLATLVPDAAEAQGLLALMLHHQARHAARRDEAGRYIPLDEQDVTLWDERLIVTAEFHLAKAAAMREPGRFQIEAAIQSAHAQRRHGGQVPWQTIVALYHWLLTHTAAMGARLGHAIATARAFGPEHGLRLLEAMEAERVRDHQPFWAAQARLLKEAGRVQEAQEAYQRAIGLTIDPAVRDYLMKQRSS